jgi:hypothetical protein
MLRVLGLAATLVAIIACAPTGSSPVPSVSSVPAGTSPSAPPDSIDLSGVPTACYGLGEVDCRRAVGEVAALMPAGAAAVYVQVGPFGCSSGEGCATTLAERPEGDITIEAGVGALSYHVTAAPGAADLTLTQQDAFGIRVGPESNPPVTPGARPFALGHCGLWSGIDAGGSWWDPVGAVDGDHPDAINAAEGTLTITDPDHATFRSESGFTVQLVRRDGEKYLPPCM